MEKSIFDLALEREKQTEALYRKMLEQTEDVGLKTILTMLADEEAKHHDDIKKRQDNVELDTNFLVEVSAILKKMKKDKKTLSINVSQPELYKQARDLEKANYEFYKEQYEVATDEKIKSILNTFCKEEYKHYELLDNLYDLVSRTDYWLEQAEFGFMDSY